MSNLIDYLNSVPLAGLMLVVMLGYLLGRMSWRGVRIGPAGGTVVVAILLGMAGLSLRELYGTDDPGMTVGFFGFALFIYSVGFEAGPRFFSGIGRGKTWQYVTIGVVVSLFALVVAVTCGMAFGLSGPVTAGLLAGALTSAQTYGAALEFTKDSLPLALSFAITYPLGLVGFVILVQCMPRFLKDDLAKDAEAPPESEVPYDSQSPIFRRTFDVEREEVIGRTLAELDLTHRTGCLVTRHHRGMDLTYPTGETRLERGDHVMAKGKVNQLHLFEGIVGRELYDEEMQNRMPSPRAIHVSSAQAVNKRLNELNLVQRHRCLVTEVVRGDVSIEPSAELRLARDDVIYVSGRRDDVRAVARELGRFERSTNETDIAIYAGGILLGLLVGSLRVGGFGIGMAAGLLLAGVFLGRFRRIGPFSAHVPAAARQLVRDLGILLFVAEAGVRAGGGSLEGIRPVLWPTLVSGALTSVIPVLAALLVGRHLLKMRPVDTWGSVGGGMTSSAALVAVKDAADSSEPAISYAASYAVASVLATFAGHAVLLLL